jgi:pimeloyl-ACP methyl ester carboxylesterase
LGFADVVFVANGAGDYRKASQAISKVVVADHLPLRVEPFLWSHGHGRIASDQLDRGHARRQGQRLAQAVAAYRLTFPQGTVSLVGHCAGCAVVLAAAEALPGGQVDRVVLLAPSASEYYDLRSALHNVRQGIDVFYSKSDYWSLGWGITLVNAVDFKVCRAAGRHGFQPIVQTAEDAVCYTKLRQYPWNASLACTGHKGGHYGSYQPDFLRVFVMPLLHR